MKTYISKFLTLSLLLSPIASFVISHDTEYTKLPEQVIDMPCVAIEMNDGSNDNNQDQSLDEVNENNSCLTQEHKNNLINTFAATGTAVASVGLQYFTGSSPATVVMHTAFGNYFKIGSLDMSWKQKSAICAALMGTVITTDYLIFPYLGLPSELRLFSLGFIGSMAILKKAQKKHLKGKMKKDKKSKKQQEVDEEEIEVVVEESKTK